LPTNRYEDPSVASYWNNKYEDEYHPYLHGRRNRVFQMLKKLNLASGSSCLELGTGGGQNAVKFVEMGFSVHGVDSSSELLEHAERLKSGNLDLDFSNVDLNSDLPFEDGKFEVVIVIGTLQYLMEPSNCIKEVFRVLKPGGHFIVCQRNAISFNVLRRPISFLCCALSSEGFEWAGRNVSTAVGTSGDGTQSVLIKRMVKFSNLRRWLEKAGFRLTEEEGYTPSFSVAPKFFSVLNKVLNALPYTYKFSHVILVTAKK
jgi:ubiquinone/menaquinone biosynthesis C-methylase UbiE